MGDAAVAIVGLIATFPMAFQITIVFLILVGGLLFLAKGFMAVLHAGTGTSKKKRR